MHSQDFDANASPRVEVDTESGPRAKSPTRYVEYDAKIKKLADAETDHQVHLGFDIQATPAEEANEKKLLRKIDWHVMPILMITYGIQVGFIVALASFGGCCLRPSLV